MARASTGELEVGTSLLSAGIPLVAAVPTVVLPVALPGHRDASPVIAAELGILAGHINAPRLIWGIPMRAILQDLPWDAGNDYRHVALEWSRL